MYLKYENACIDAGFTKEKTKEVRKVCDSGRNKLLKQNQRMEAKGITLTSLSSLGLEDEEYGVPDPSFVSMDCVCSAESDMEILKGILQEFPSEKIEFLMIYFGEANKNLSLAARMVNIPRTTANGWKDQLMKKIRERFFEICPEDYTDIFKI